MVDLNMPTAEWIEERERRKRSDPMPHYLRDAMPAKARHYIPARDSGEMVVIEAWLRWLADEVRVTRFSADSDWGKVRRMRGAIKASEEGMAAKVMPEGGADLLDMRSRWERG